MNEQKNEVGKCRNDSMKTPSLITKKGFLLVVVATASLARKTKVRNVKTFFLV